MGARAVALDRRDDAGGHAARTGVRDSGAVALFLGSSAVTLCAGHSIGLHRLLIHRSLSAPRWMERVLVLLGTLVGMAGPLGMVRLHDMRDWAQRQAACHDLHAHRAHPLRDARWWVLLALRRLGLVWGLRQPGDLTPRAGLRRVSCQP